MAVIKKTNNKKIFAWLIGIMIALILISIGVYFLMKYLRDKRAEKELLASQQAALPASSGGTSAPPKPTSSSSGSGGGSSAPPVTPMVDSPYPLEKGSKGENVLYLQKFLNRLFNANIKEDGVFGTPTYNTIITKLGTRYYPVTHDYWIEIADKAHAKK